MTTDRRKASMLGALELATSPVVSVRGGIGAMDALREMYGHGVHHLAVLPETTPGLVTTTDLLFGIAARRPGEQVPVETLCRRPAPSVAVGDSGAVAAERMIEAGSDAVLVLEGARVRGVLTAVDLVRAIAAGQHTASP